MNILFICDEYPPGKNGGVGTMVQVLGRELVKQGHRVYVAGLYSYRYGQADYEKDQGVHVWRLRFGLNLNVKSTSRWYTLFLEKLPPIVRRNLNGRKAFNRFMTFVLELVEREKIDVIEVPDWNNFTFFIGFPVKWPAFKIPLVVKSHGSYSKICKELHKKTNTDFVQTDLNLYKRGKRLFLLKLIPNLKLNRQRYIKTTPASFTGSLTFRNNNKNTRKTTSVV